MSRGLARTLALMSAHVALSAAPTAQEAEAAFSAQRWTHDSGIEVYYYPVDDLPIVDASLILDTGSARDPAGKEGLASLAAGLASAGAGDLDENAIAEEIARIGAEFDVDVDRDMTVLSMRVLADAPLRDRAMGLLAMMVREPTFPEDVLGRRVTQRTARLRQSLTEPETIVRRNFRAALFGDHPYGKLVTEESLAAITRDDVTAHHRANTVRARMRLAVVGDVSREEADRIASLLTDGIPGGEPAAPIADPAAPAEPDALEVEHPSAQSHIMVGHLGLKRNDPDYFALQLGSEILGGGMTSRLFEEVREKRGLAYSVYSYFAPTGALGEFVMGAQTSREQAPEVRKIMVDTLRRLIEEGPDEQELANAKESWRKGFALRLDSNRRVMSYMEVIAHYGLPLDYPDHAAREIGKIGAEDVRDALRRRIDPSALSVVVVGA